MKQFFTYTENWLTLAYCFTIISCMNNVINYINLRPCEKNVLCHIWTEIELTQRNLVVW